MSRLSQYGKERLLDAVFGASADSEYEGYPPDREDVSQPSTNSVAGAPTVITSVALLDAQGNVIATQPVHMAVSPGDSIAFNTGDITFGFS